MKFPILISLVKNVLISIKTLRDLFDNKDIKENKEKKQVPIINNNYYSNKEVDFKNKSKLNNYQQKLQELFNIHNIDDKLIVEFINKIIDENFLIPSSKVDDLSYVFDKLEPKHIDKLINILGVNKGWLHSEEELYPFRDFYKNVGAFISFIKKKSSNEKLQGIAVKLDDFDNENKSDEQNLYLIIRTPITQLYKKTIYKYYHIETNWKWNYWRTRFQIKSIFRIFEQVLNIMTINGKTLTKEELIEISNRNNCPDKILRNKTQNTWYPYDYATTKDENYEAKDLEETVDIIKYIEKNSYLNYC